MCGKSMRKAITAAGCAGLLTYAICSATSKKSRKLKCKMKKMMRSYNGIASIISSFIGGCC